MFKLQPYQPSPQDLALLKRALEGYLLTLSETFALARIKRKLESH